MTKLTKRFKQRGPRVPTDLEILLEICERYYQTFANFVKGENDNRTTKIYVPIDIKKIAKAVNVDSDIVFGRLYDHLGKKHRRENPDGPKDHFFTIDEIPGERHCVHFPLMASVLADLRHEHPKFVTTTWISIVALVVSFVSLAISIFSLS